MKQNTTIINKIIIAGVGVLGSIFFILLGYWIAGGIGYTQSEKVGFLTGLNTVLGAPFAPYFNNYTPILMLLFFVIFESVFFFMLMSLRRNERIAEAEETENAGMSEENEKALAIDEAVFSDIFTGSDQSEKQQIRNEEDADFGIIIPDIQKTDDMHQTGQIIEKDKDIEQSVEQPKAVFNDDIAMELLGEYTLDQVTAMLDISKYMNVNVAMLRKMFQPSMDADEIREYIRTFYE